MARKKKPEEHANHERWLVSYADFITLLFAFFTTLYAISTVDKTKAGKMAYSMRTAFNVEMFQTPEELQAYQGIAAPAVAMEGSPGVGSEGGQKAKHGDPDNDDEELGKLAQELKGIIDSPDNPEVKQSVSVKVEERGITISLAEAGFFGSGDADIDEASKKAIDALVAKMGGVKLPIAIEGHTDNRPVRGGKYRDNRDLSTARANSVLKYIEQAHSIDPSRLKAIGYGEFKPVGDNSTEEGRGKNRRVDIVILRNDDGPTALKQAGEGDADAKVGADKDGNGETPAKKKSADDTADE